MPWSADPLGAMLAPLALLAMVYGRKKQRGKWDKLVIVAVLGLTLGMGLAACDGKTTDTPEATEVQITATPTATPAPSSTPTVTITLTVDGATQTFTVPVPTGTPSPSPTLTITCIAEVTSTPTPNSSLTPAGLLARGYFEELNSKSGWWNKNQAGKFTIEQMLGIFMLYEADGHRDNNTGTKIPYYLKEIVGYQLWANTKARGGNSPYCLSEPCFNGVMNFMGAYQGGYLAKRFGNLSNDMENTNGHPRLARLSEDGAKKNNKVVDKVVDECGITPGYEGNIKKEALTCEAEKWANYVLHENIAHFQNGDFSIEFSDNVKQNLPYHWGNDMASAYRSFIVLDIDWDLLYQWP